MGQYLLYVIGGYGEAVLIALPLSVSAGIASPWPYFAIAGALLLFSICAILSVLFEKPAALVAIVAAALYLSWPVASLLSFLTKGESNDSVAAFVVIPSLVPVVVIADAVTRLRRRRAEPWFTKRSEMRALWRVMLIALPLAPIAVMCPRQQVFFLPAGFSGPAVLVFGDSQGGRVHHRFLRYEFRIPHSGIATYRDSAPPGGVYLTDYFVVSEDGSQRKVPDGGDQPSTDVLQVFGEVAGAGQKQDGASIASIEYISFIVGVPAARADWIKLRTELEQKAWSSIDVRSGER